MTKLSANRAAKEAGIAKKTLLEAISSGRLTATKNEKGHWEIEPAELFRVYPKTGGEQAQKPQPTHQENRQNTSENSALETEVKMLREQIDKIETLHERERQTLVDQIGDLRTEAERRSREHMQALAALTDQRTEKPRKRFLGIPIG